MKILASSPLPRRWLLAALGGFLAVTVLLTAVFATVPRSLSAAAPSRKLPVYCTDRADNVIALTFDAAWGDEDTPTLIEILGRYNIRATFFVVGEWVDRCEKSVKALHEAGHEIMNHSDSHPHMPALSRSQMIDELERCNDKIEAVTGIRPTLHRAPYGDYSNESLEAAESIGMMTVQWDVDSLDWKDLSASEITQRVTSKAKSGSIVLFHNAALHTPEALPTIIESLQTQGYSFITVSEMLYTENYTINHEGRQCKEG